MNISKGLPNAKNDLESFKTERIADVERIRAVGWYFVLIKLLVSAIFQDVVRLEKWESDTLRQRMEDIRLISEKRKQQWVSLTDVCTLSLLNRCHLLASLQRWLNLATQKAISIVWNIIMNTSKKLNSPNAVSFCIIRNLDTEREIPSCSVATYQTSPGGGS